jgi:hypothetical protein
MGEALDIGASQTLPERRYTRSLKWWHTSLAYLQNVIDMSILDEGC